MRKVIKPQDLVQTGQIVEIPDAPPPPEPEQEPPPQEGEPTPEQQGEAPPAPPPPEEDIPRVPAPDLVAQAIAESNAMSVRAREQADQVLEVARLERMKLLEQAQAEAEEIRRTAREEGYRDGKEEMAQRADQCVAEVRQALEQMIAGEQTYFETYERELKYTALAIAEKILQRAVDENGTEMMDLIRAAVASVKNAEWVSVEVSDRLVTLIHQLRKEFATQEGGRRVDISPQPVAADSCVLRTEEGVVDASIPTQLKNLRDLFAKMDEG